MIYTPHHAMLDHELMLFVASKTDATDLEIELALRLELVLDQLETADSTKPPTKTLFELEEMLRRGPDA